MPRPIADSNGRTVQMLHIGALSVVQPPSKSFGSSTGDYFFGILATSSDCMATLFNFQHKVSYKCSTVTIALK